MTRKQPTLTEKCAAALLALGDISHEHAKLMHPEQILSLYNFDHYPIRHADGGSNHPSNLRPLLIGAHREKTAKHDAPDMAHERKVKDRHQEHQRVMAGGEPSRSRWPQGRKIQSRGFGRCRQ